MIKLTLITAVWCPSCLIMRPRYQTFISKNPEIDFKELDFDTDDAMVRKLSVGKTLPVAIIEDERHELLRIVGEKSAHEIERLLKPCL